MMVRERRISCGKIDYFIKDEKHADREYSKLGLPKLAKDERKHMMFFKGLRMKQCRR